MPVGEVFLGAFLDVLFNRLAPDNLCLFPSEDGIRVELKKWEKKLMMIQAVLEDAEEKQLSNRAVKIWLDDLRALAYDVEDIFDEQQLTTRPSFSILHNLPSNLVSQINLGSKIKEVTSRLEELCDRRNVLELEKTSSAVGRAASVSTVSWQRPPTPCLATEPAVYGRDGDKAKVLDMVLSHDTSNDDVNFRVISIVGMAGVGKTTLARLVYNDLAVEDFNSRAWVCVSDDFDILRISKAILESITLSSCDFKDLNPVQVKLKQEVAGRKFLIVLDDVWSKDYGLWEVLKSPFMAGAPGSKIIVTTRDENVALMLGCPGECHNLELLSDKDCWSVFKKHAFASREFVASPRLCNSKFVRRKVVEKCKGLPLAARTLGGLLRCKQRDAEWQDVLNSNKWDLSDDSEIPAVLKLSYHHLPSHLKRCFAYCAIFPKDYEFEEKEVVLLWIAEGLIPQSTDYKQLEDAGVGYFRDLLSRSIFQQANGDGSKFIMHDLINDLAQWVSGETSFRLEDGANNRSQRFERALHSSFISRDFDGKSKFEVFNKVEHLRTFLPIILHEGTRYITNFVLSEVLSKFKKLRVLSLRNYYITEVPNSIRLLTHLRYLNFSGTRICDIPESVGFLCHLQILLLKDCHRLKKLPTNVENLIDLLYFDISGQNLITEMPVGMNKLKCLRTLSNFVVGLNTGSGLEDLKSLKFLRGKLCISKLRNVVQDIREPILSVKEDLEVLQLEWESLYLHDSSECSRVPDINVLDGLRPHGNLKELSIIFYGGTNFPSWVGDPSFFSIVDLRLENCEKCTCLPALGALPSLKELTIKGLRKLITIGSQIYGDDCLKPFQSLETLCCQNLGAWFHWDPIAEDGQVEKFPVLRKLSILNCPRLSERLPDHLPSLEELEVRGCEVLVVSLSGLPLLCKLELSSCKRMVCRSIDSKSIKHATLSNISEFSRLSRHNFQKVECLKIIGCEELEHLWNEICLEELPHGLRSVASLRKLFVANCRSLVSFLEACFLSNLSELVIQNCSALISLNEVMKHNYLHLKSLQIEGCQSLMLIARRRLPSSLTKVEIRNCENLQCLVDNGDDSSASLSSSSATHGENINNTSLSLLESLDISGCQSLMCLSRRGQLSTVLRRLKIQTCPKLKSLSSSGGQLPVAIKHLEVQNCAELTTLSSTGKLPEALQYLSIADCPQLESIAESFHDNAALVFILIGNCKKLQSVPNALHKLVSLDQMYIGNCPSLVSFPDERLPNQNLRVIEISRCEELRPLPSGVERLNSLQELDISLCPRIVSIPASGLPTNLTSLSIEDLKIYMPLSCWGLHKLTSHRKLEIRGCPSAVSFPEELVRMRLPTTLTKLNIARFPKLEYLSSRGLQNLTSLEYLSISECPNLKSFPEEGLPSSLQQLYVEDCPWLGANCERYGPEWSKIAHIPCVMIDMNFIHDPSYLVVFPQRIRRWIE
ncbi:putative disease resistance RPP13-like protein 1 [Citrus sinensis]|uniref:Disease resistance RPP13-like protein 1 n=1 Tax=Citrus sinensis TaxID=2711 RepID=A0ACB8P3M8_CITSI|nr:putative disease resistance RPP13-like protein 1 [Citrus sinensis]